MAHSPIDRRQTLGVLLAAAGVAGLSRPVLAQDPARAFGAAVTEPYVVVETANGKVRGGHSRGALAFKGLAYAGSVSGAGRFKAAPPPPSWTGVRDALHPGAPAIQPPGGTYGELEPPYSEDCLALNVWTPAVGDGRKRAVVFYNHGGGFASGSGAAVDADGAHLARDFDVVVVASNHRLGLLGYLYLGELGGEAYATSGNQGMLDIVAALSWVKNNIEAFGGDPDNVMVFGESGGGAKTCALCAMPSARGLFHKIGVMSGPYLRATARQDATALARAVLAKLDIAPGDLDRLAEAPTSALLDAQAQVHVGPSGPGFRIGEASVGFGPVMDGDYLSQDPFDPAPAPWLKDLPLIVGMNRDETRFFVWAAKQPQILTMDDAAMTARVRRELGDAYADQVLPVFRRDRPQATPSDLYIALAEARWWRQSITIAERKFAQQGAPVFMYRYDYESNYPIPGTDQTLRAAHATEKPAKFDNPDYAGLMGDRPDRVQMCHTMGELWATFAKTGQPAAQGQPAWPAYDPAQRATMLIDVNCTVADDPFQAERLALQSVIGDG